MDLRKYNSPTINRINLLAIATKALISRISAIHWLTRTHLGLQGKSPTEYAKTYKGKKEVLDILSELSVKSLQ